MKYSFIIPSLNSSHTISECLASILVAAMLFSEDNNVEIILVDNGSNDNTREIARQVVKNLIVINNPTHSRSISRNLGARKASGDYLCFVDYDIKISPKWLLEVDRVLSERSNVNMLSTKIFPIPQEGKNISSQYNFIVEKIRSSVFLGDHPFLFLDTKACVYQKEFFNKLLGFDESLLWYEDMDLSRRASVNGGVSACSVNSFSVILDTESSLTKIIHKAYVSGKCTPAYYYKWADYNVRQNIPIKVWRSGFGRLIYFMKAEPVKLLPLATLCFVMHSFGVFINLIKHEK